MGEEKGDEIFGFGAGGGVGDGEHERSPVGFRVTDVDGGALGEFGGDSGEVMAVGVAVDRKIWGHEGMIMGPGAKRKSENVARAPQSLSSVAGTANDWDRE